jgi:hypothetical protein
VRLLGVTASNLGERVQLQLFSSEGEAAGDAARGRRVVEAEDAIRRRFGERAVTRARLLGTGLPAPFEHDPMTAPEHRGPRHSETR